MLTQGNRPTVPIGALGKGAGAEWPYIEQSPGVFQWSTLDGLVGVAQALGVGFMYSSDNVPYWAMANKSGCATGTNGVLYCVGPPDNISDLDAFYTALVTRYCPGGNPLIESYELWNEPYDDVNHVQPSPSAMATIAQHEHDIIRAHCPAAKIVSPSMASGSYYENYASAYFAAGGPTDVDAVGFHAYTYNQTNAACDMPEAIVLAPPNATPGCALYDTSLQALLNQYVPGKPLWNTEGSWNWDNQGFWQTSNLQAAFIARWYILHWATGITRMYWFEWDHGTIGTLCTGSFPCTPVAAPATALQQTANWLVGRTMYNGCATASDGVTWTCPLSGPNGYQALIVWNTAGNSSYTPPSPSLYTQYRNLAGGVSSYSGGAVTIGLAPILLEN
jgi:hypothetical protein